MHCRAPRSNWRPPTLDIGSGGSRRTVRAGKDVCQPVNRHHTSTSLLPNWEGGAQTEVTVDVPTLGHAIEQFGLPVYCKIDVEGFELLVLQGLSQAIRTISFEFHSCGDGVEIALNCLSRLTQLGDLEVKHCSRGRHQSRTQRLVDTCRFHPTVLQRIGPRFTILLRRHLCQVRF